LSIKFNKKRYFYLMQSLFQIKIDLSHHKPSMIGFQKDQFPFALSKALTATAWDAYWDIRSQLPIIFDRPTPWTIKAMYVQKATKHSLYAELGYKEWAHKGTASVKIMGHFVRGGTRPFKRSEKLLQQKSLIPKGHFLIQSKAATKNQYGNIPASKYNQMLSGVGAQLDTAQRSSRTSARRKTRNNAQRFFVGTPRGGNRAFAVYERLRGKLRPLFMVSARASYKPRYNIRRMVETTIRQNFERNLNVAMEYAIRTAKK
jgi:hypothetical protein